MAYQSLYRRYRPRTFGAIRGQEHVVTALRNAVRSGTEGHAYLFSGPRGTGKTSTARIFAKALNCTDLRDGEPCLECESCVAIEAGRSYDLFELDAASNSGVEAMRELIGRSVVASPGRTKVYILDEVHMLTPGASNALLKTLEEPPEHVKFVLATTDPHKVLPTIRSRTQHLEFSLIPAEVLTDHVRWVIGDAGLDVDDAAVAAVVREGRGSARDALSALDRVVAAGGMSERRDGAAELLAALGAADVGAVMAAVAAALDAGRDPRVLGESMLSGLRNAFLIGIGAPVVQLPDDERAGLAELAERVGAARLTRALEAIGAALVDMRQAPDPRIPLEVALIRLCDPATDASLAALAERVERLERRVDSPPAGGAPDAGDRTAGSATGSAGSGAKASAPRRQPNPPGRSPGPAPPKAAPTPPRPRDVTAAQPVAAVEPSPARNRPPAAVASGSDGSVDAAAVTAAIAAVVGEMKGIAKAIYSQGVVDRIEGSRIVMALENAPTVARAERDRGRVESSLSQQLGIPVTLALVGQRGSPGAVASVTDVSPAVATPSASSRAGGSDEELIETDDLMVAADVPSTGVDRLAAHFPGATVIEEHSP